MRDEFSPNQPAALNLLGCIDTTGASPFLIPVSSYNELLEAAGEKTIVLGIDEAVFYLNPDFQGSTKEETTTMLNQIAEDARAMLALYGVAIARTANREISKLNWKPNA